MSTPSPIVSAVVDALSHDPNALDQLATALAPRLAALCTVVHSGPLTTAQASQRAGVHERTVRRALAAGTLDGHTIVGRWRIEPHSVDSWLRLGAPTSTTPTHGNGRPQHGVTAGVNAIAGREAA